MWFHCVVDVPFIIYADDDTENSFLRRAQKTFFIAIEILSTQWYAAIFLASQRFVIMLLITDKDVFGVFGGCWDFFRLKVAFGNEVCVTQKNKWLLRCNW
jgi:hypothetical protein